MILQLSFLFTALESILKPFFFFLSCSLHKRCFKRSLNNPLWFPLRCTTNLKRSHFKFVYFPPPPPPTYSRQHRPPNDPEIVLRSYFLSVVEDSAMRSLNNPSIRCFEKKLKLNQSRFKFPRHLNQIESIYRSIFFYLHLGAFSTGHFRAVPLIVPAKELSHGHVISSHSTRVTSPLANDPEPASGTRPTLTQ